MDKDIEYLLRQLQIEKHKLAMQSNDLNALLKTAKQQRVDIIGDVSALKDAKNEYNKAVRINRLATHFSVTSGQIERGQNLSDLAKKNTHEVEGTLTHLQRQDRKNYADIEQWRAEGVPKWRKIHKAFRNGEIKTKDDLSELVEDHNIRKVQRGEKERRKLYSGDDSKALKSLEITVEIPPNNSSSVEIEKTRIPVKRREQKLLDDLGEIPDRETHDLMHPDAAARQEARESLSKSENQRHSFLKTIAEKLSGGKKEHRDYAKEHLKAIKKDKNLWNEFREVNGTREKPGFIQKSISKIHEKLQRNTVDIKSPLERSGVVSALHHENESTRKHALDSYTEHIDSISDTAEKRKRKRNLIGSLTSRSILGKTSKERDNAANMLNELKSRGGFEEAFEQTKIVEEKSKRRLVRRERKDGEESINDLVADTLHGKDELELMLKLRNEDKNKIIPIIPQLVSSLNKITHIASKSAKLLEYICNRGLEKEVEKEIKKLPDIFKTYDNAFIRMLPQDSILKRIFRTLKTEKAVNDANEIICNLNRKENREILAGQMNKAFNVQIDESYFMGCRVASRTKIDKEHDILVKTVIMPVETFFLYYGITEDNKKITFGYSIEEMQQMLLEKFNQDVLENINSSDIHISIYKKPAILREGKGFEKIVGINAHTGGVNCYSKAMDYPFNIVAIRVVADIDAAMDGIEHEERHGLHRRQVYLNGRHDFSYTKIYDIISEIYAYMPIAKKKGWHNIKERLDKYLHGWGAEYKEPIHKIIDLIDWLQKNDADEKEIEDILLNNYTLDYVIKKLELLKENTPQLSVKDDDAAGKETTLLQSKGQLRTVEDEQKQRRTDYFKKLSKSGPTEVHEVNKFHFDGKPEPEGEGISLVKRATRQKKQHILEQKSAVEQRINRLLEELREIANQQDAE